MAAPTPVSPQLRSPKDGTPTSKTVGTSSFTRPVISLQPSSMKDPSKSRKLFRRVQSVFRAFPIITPAACKISATRPHEGRIHGGHRVTGTLFGYRKSRVNLAIQENPRSLPVLVLELAIPTGKLLQDMGVGLVRIALESEKKSQAKTKIIDEPIWTMFCNGKKTGYGVKRQAMEDDLMAMQMLHGVSMGAGVLPGDGKEQPDGEMTYMRAPFDRVVGSRDSETYYMVTPDGMVNGPELSIFFVRL